MNCMVGRLFSCVVLFFSVFVFIDGSEMKGPNVGRIDICIMIDENTTDSVENFSLIDHGFFNGEVNVKDRIKQLIANGYVKYREEVGFVFPEFVKTINFFKKDFFKHYVDETKYDNFDVLRYTKKCKFGELKKYILDKGWCLEIKGMKVYVLDEAGMINLGYFCDSKGVEAQNEKDIRCFMYTRNLYEKDNHGQIIEIGGCDRRTNEVTKAIKDFNTQHVVPKPKPSPNPHVAPKPVNSGSSSGSSSPEKKKCCKCCCCR